MRPQTSDFRPPISNIQLSPLPDNPLVSIIVPSFNQGAFIRQTLDSVLDQDYRPIEVIVIDGASTDNTLEVLHSYDNVPEICWISEPDSGVVEAVNKGFARARGEIGAIQSTDDYYFPDAISKIVERFEIIPDVGLLYGDCVKIDAAGKELNRFKSAPFTIENFLSKQSLILQPATFFRLELAKELGGWDKSYFNADTELWLRMVFRTKVEKIDEFYAARRMHSGQRDKHAADIVESYCRMIDASPDIKNASRKIREAAECGKYLHIARYNPRGIKVLRRYYYLRALMAYPPISRCIDLAGIFLPGYYPLHNFLSFIKRAIFNKVAPTLHKQ